MWSAASNTRTHALPPFPPPPPPSLPPLLRPSCYHYIDIVKLFIAATHLQAVAALPGRRPAEVLLAAGSLVVDQEERKRRHLVEGRHRCRQLAGSPAEAVESWEVALPWLG